MAEKPVLFTKEFEEFEILGHYVDFEVEVREISNDGIGSYEFWGAKGFDKGNDYVEDYAVVNVRPSAGEALSDEMFAEILKVLFGSSTNTEANEAAGNEIQEALDDSLEEYKESLMEREEDFDTTGR